MRGALGAVLCLVTIFAIEPLAASTGAPPPAAKNTPKSVTLPPAYVGIPYSKIFSVVSNIPYGRAQCKLDNSPSWLTFDEGRFQFAGVPNDPTSVEYQIKLTMTDVDDSSKTEVFTLILPVVNGTEVIYADPRARPNAKKLPAANGGSGMVIDSISGMGKEGAPPAATIAPAAAPKAAVAFYSLRPKLDISSQVVEGDTSISGYVAGIPLGVPALPDVEVWIHPYRQQPYLAQLSSPDSEGNPGKITQLPLKTDTFTATLATPLQAGEKVIIRLVVPQGSGIALEGSEADFSRCDEKADLSRCFDLPDEIPYPEIFVPEQLTVGTQSISGYVRDLPKPPIAATAANPTSNVVGTPGNLPLIGVEVDDPQNGKSLTGLQVSLSDTETAVQVSATGTFNLRLAKALAAGQSIRLIAVPPAGHHFFPDRHDGDEIGVIPGRYRSEGNAGQNIEAPVQGRLEVFTPLAVAEPTITSALSDNVTALAGSATASATGGTAVSVAVLRLREDESRYTGSCITSDEMDAKRNGHGLHYELITGTSGTSNTVATGTTGAFSLTLANPLHEGDRIQIVQILPAGTHLIALQEARCFSAVYQVPEVADWGRVHADFTAGLLLSNNNLTTLNAQSGQSQDNGDFSQAHEFLDLTVDKSWSFPACYLRRFAVRDDDENSHMDQCYDSDKVRYIPAERWQHLWPGVNSYFDARLTAIPVSQLSTTTTTTSTSTPGSTTTPTSALSASNQLTSAQTARVGVGVYFPFLITRWDYHHAPNALFLAPLAKVGFDTVTGPSSQTVVLPDGSLGSVNLENLYNFYAVGGRIGHFHMTQSFHRAPETYSYLDIVAGPFSNLESFICKRTILESATTSSGTTTIPAPGYSMATTYPGSTCVDDYPDYYDIPVPAGAVPNLPSGTTLSYAPYDSRKRLYRLDLEGMLKLPSTPLYVGFNANLGQRSLGAKRLDHGYAAPDDLRFLFGTRFDIGTLLTKIGVTPF